jgi:hypothetical protein
MIEQILNEIAEEQGWDVYSQLSLLVEYIERQRSPEAFKDYLLDAADNENRSVSNG